MIDDFSVTVEDIINNNYVIQHSDPLCIDNLLWINVSDRKVYRYVYNNWIEVDTIENFFKLLNIVQNSTFDRRVFRSCAG